MAFVPPVYNPVSASESDYPVPSYTTASDTSPHYYPIYSPVDNSHSNWQSAGSNYDASYDPVQLAGHVSARLPPQSSELPLHAPAPLSGQASSLLISQCPGAYYTAPMETHEAPLNQPQISPPTLPPSLCEPYKLMSGREPGATRRPPTTFPTPSAMLTELSIGTRPPSLMVQSSEPKSEPARKARRRAMAQTIGFEPTDPDVISSHEKKRHYLECLEYYVTYLHQQLSLVGCEPARLERPTTSTRGMSSQSIRTLLVHMEHLTRRLNQEMLTEEQRFIHLRGTAEQLQDSEA
ncbi:hypothetical protein J132_09870 [Termitomyces sp. J132]|nr:hypothetical protein H2248_000786 [Termitomyces sp. 'cryptogamus']KNZ71416.1 hypothetical protein J132_09870 [Termitomyces sp. J132]